MNEFKTDRLAINYIHTVNFWLSAIYYFQVVQYAIVPLFRSLMIYCCLWSLLSIIVTKRLKLIPTYAKIDWWTGWYFRNEERIWGHKLFLQVGNYFSSLRAVENRGEICSNVQIKIPGISSIALKFTFFKTRIPPGSGLSKFPLKMFRLTKTICNMPFIPPFTRKTTNLKVNF